MEKLPSEFSFGDPRIGGMMIPTFGGPLNIQFSRLASRDVDDESVQPSPEECETYALYLNLPELSRLQKMRLWPGWPLETIVRPVLHSLEMVFSMISCVLCDQRSYIDRDEWLRRLEALANSQLEVLSFICEGDCHAPTTKQQQSTALNPPGAVSKGGGWQQKATGSRATAFRCSQESLLPRMATWKKAQGLVTRLHFAIEGHMLRVPFGLGLGEPNLSGKPVLEYDKICTPMEVAACLRASTIGNPEDHALVTAHQIMEAWLIVAQGLAKSVEERVSAADAQGAATKCWILERVWKLLTSTMDLLQVMDPDDFMKLKHKLAVQSAAVVGKKRLVTAGAAFCLRSTMLRTVTKACKELRSLVPTVVGVEVDPKGGPRLQEAIMELFNSHGHMAKGHPYHGRPYSYYAGTIHLLQAFQAMEIAIRQFYFTYRHLVITVMGSGEYTGTIQSEISGADVLLQLYSEPPYFPSVDGARTFLGDYWHHHTPALEQAGVTARQAAAVDRQTSKPSGLCSSSSSSNNSSAAGSEEEMTCFAVRPPVKLSQTDDLGLAQCVNQGDYVRAQQQRQLLEEASGKSGTQPRLHQNLGIGA